MSRSGVSDSPFPFAVIGYRAPSGRVRADAAEAALAAALPGTSRLAAGNGTRVHAPPSARQVGGRWIIGEYHGALSAAPPLADLTAQGWGRYVAIDVAPDLTVLRDPSGAVPVWLLVDHELALFASTVTPTLARAAGFHLSIDDRALAHALAHPSATAHLSFLEGVERLTAGEIASWSDGRIVRRTAWSPAPIAVRAQRRSEVDARAGLVDAVTQAAETIAGSTRGPLLLELSGGFDSSIVMGAIAAVGAARRTTALNLASRQAPVDERSYARAVAERAGVPLREAWLDAETIDIAELERRPQPPEPLNFALDLSHNRVLADEVVAVGAEVVLTGQGGDAVFFQMATPLVGVDLVRLEGWRALSGAAGWAAAHRARTTLWAIAALALKDRFGTITPPTFPPALLTPEAAGGIDPARLRHPWARDGVCLPPAKALQIDALANCQLFVGPTIGSGTARQRHPLLSQPLVELCLQLPVPQLADGPLDRALARRAFAPWLPSCVQNRRGKGEAAGHYNRAVVRNLGTLRRLLLDGYLVERGLLDRDRVDELLSENALLWREDYRLLLVTVSLELWARWWRTQSRSQ